MWNSTSRVTETGTKYGCPELDALINFIGCAIEQEEDANDPLKKDDECTFHYSSYLAGITNGEYIYTIFEIFSEMTGDEPSADAPFFKEAVLGSLLDGLREEFLESLDGEEFPAEQAQDIWSLYSACRRNHKSPLWVDHEDKEVETPALSEIEADDWERILEEIHDEFLWDRDWELGLFGGTNFALLKEQPHFPNLQEFRTAKVWLLTAYSNTRQNQKAVAKES